MSNQPPTERPRVLLRVGRIRGVPVVVAPSFLLIAVLLTALYAPVVAGMVPSISSSTAYLAAFGFALLFGICVLAHELGHTLVSTLLHHPVRRVVLFALGGASEIDSEPERARDELLIAASGPLVSVLIAAGTFAGYAALPTGSIVAAMFGLLWWSNMLLAAFNLLPGLPLDGGRMLRAGVWACGGSKHTGTRVAGWTGRLLAIAVAISGLVVERTTLGIAAGLFSLGLAAYLWLAASQSLRMATMLSRLPNVAVDELLRPGMFVPGDVSVGEALRRAWAGNVRGLVVMDAAQQPSAIVDELLIGTVPPDRRAWTPVSAVARPLEPGLVVPDGLDAAALLARMQATPAHEYLVMRTDGTPAGIITARDFARQLQAGG